jgi:ureidoacrylate peracid hydrolase
MLRTLAEKADPKHAALIVVDVQNDFCHTDGHFARAGKDMSMVERMVPRLAKLIEAARNAGTLVIFTQDTHSQATISETQREEWFRTHAGFDPAGEPHVCRKGGWGAEFFTVSPQPGDIVVEKHRYSAFIDTDLDLVLRSHGIRSLLMTGVASSGCVESTARDGFMKNYYITFVDDCSATYSQQRHESATTAIAESFGVVHQSEEIMSTWSRVGEPVPAD